VSDKETFGEGKSDECFDFVRLSEKKNNLSRPVYSNFRQFQWQMEEEDLECRIQCSLSLFNFIEKYRKRRKTEQVTRQHICSPIRKGKT
jgi:hypothetical protein